MNIKKLSIYIMSGFLFACAAREHAAPIENVTLIPNYLKQDTVAGISKNVTRQGDADEEPQLGSLESSENKVKPATAFQPFQNKNSYKVATNTAARTSTLTIANNNEKSSDKESLEWVIPTKGKIQKFIAANKGIDIIGSEGQPIYSSNNGNVVYSGNGLKGYGNLIIIKHENTYLSAYAHNKVNLVKAGDRVRRGQKIAEMGLNDNDSAVLHFEIRQNGKPIDPMQLVKN